MDKNTKVSIDKVLSLLENHLGPDSEIVFHDLTLPYEHTIVDIRGHLTGREIGGCGSNLGLEIIAAKEKNGDRFNYITHTKNGLILRSSTVYIYDEEDESKPVAAICLNTNITNTLQLETMLRKYNGYTPVNDPSVKEETHEHFAKNVSELLEMLLLDAQDYVGSPAPHMTKEEKLKFLSYLDSKGAFLISKSGEHVSNFLGISKVTLYSYLDTIRNN